MTAANMTIAKLNSDIPIQSIGAMGFAPIRITLGASATYDTGGIAVSRDKLAGVLGWRTIHALAPYRVFGSSAAGTNVQASWVASSQKLFMEECDATPAELGAVDVSTYVIDALAFGM